MAVWTFPVNVLCVAGDDKPKGLIGTNPVSIRAIGHFAGIEKRMGWIPEGHEQAVLSFLGNKRAAKLVPSFAEEAKSIRLYTAPNRYDDAVRAPNMVSS